MGKRLNSICDLLGRFAVLLNRSIPGMACGNPTDWGAIE